MAFIMSPLGAIVVSANNSDNDTCEGCKSHPAMERSRGSKPRAKAPPWGRKYLSLTHRAPGCNGCLVSRARAVRLPADRIWLVSCRAGFRNMVLLAPTGFQLWLSSFTNTPVLYTRRLFRFLLVEPASVPLVSRGSSRKAWNAHARSTRC